MNIIVCIKQVPGTSEVQINPVTGVLVRDSNNTKMNPYDLYGLETALRIKEQINTTDHPTTVKTISMGPPPAKAVLVESLWMGCDQGLLISDRKFGGADVVATAYTLAQGIKTLGDADLIICGKQTTDGDTAQVGPEMAEYLQIPHVAYVEEVIEVKEKSIVVKASMDDTVETYEVNFPCLITVDKCHFTPRLPSYKRGRQFKDQEIPMLTFADFADQDENHYGLKGSPTQVERMFAPTRNDDKVILEGDEFEVSQKLYQLLKESKFV